MASTSIKFPSTGSSSDRKARPLYHVRQHYGWYRAWFKKRSRPKRRLGTRMTPGPQQTRYRAYKVSKRWRFASRKHPQIPAIILQEMGRNPEVQGMVARWKQFSGQEAYYFHKRVFWPWMYRYVRSQLPTIRAPKVRLVGKFVSQTVAAYLRHYPLDEHLAGERATTLIEMFTAWRAANPKLSAEMLAAVDRGQAVAFELFGRKARIQSIPAKRWAEVDAKLRSQKLEPHDLRSVAVALAKIFAWASFHGWADGTYYSRLSAVVRRYPRPKVEYQRRIASEKTQFPRPLDPVSDESLVEFLSKLREAIEGPVTRGGKWVQQKQRLLLKIQIQRLTGCHAREVCAMRWNEISGRRFLSKETRRWFWTPGRKKVYALCPAAKRLLLAWKAVYGRDGDEWVFGSRPSPFASFYYNDFLRRLCAKWKLPQITTSQIRDAAIAEFRESVWPEVRTEPTHRRRIWALARAVKRIRWRLWVPSGRVSVQHRDDVSAA